MKRSIEMKRSIVLAASAALLGSMALAADSAPKASAIPVDQIAWQSVAPGVPSFAYLVGRPDQPGFYVMRAKFPDGFRSAPHYHDKDRYVTVISGVWHMGTNTSGGCEGTIALPPGSFAIHPANAVHYDGSCGGEVVVQIMGEGPVKTFPAKP